MNKEILRLAIPNILTNLSVPLVSLVDLGLMGRMPSVHYIVAIGFGTVIFNFIYWAFGFLRMGTTGMVSQAFGKNNLSITYQLLIQGLFVSISAGILLLLFQYPLKLAAIGLIQPDVEIIQPITTYFNWRIWAAPATISTYVLTGWLLGMQDSKSALVIALLVNGLNALLSYLFVRYFSLSIQGIALGTVIAQYSGFLIGIFIVYKQYKFRIPLSKFLYFIKSIDWREFVSVNSNIFIRTICLIFVMSFFKTKAGNIDPILGAANILLIEFISLSAYGIDGFAFAAESMCGKYFGKNKITKFKHAVKTSFIWGIGFSFLVSFIFFVFGQQILRLLTDKDNVIQAALPYLPWLIFAPIINGFAFIWDGIYVGTTATKAMRNTLIIATFIIFLPFYYWLNNLLNNHGIWLAFTLFMLSRGIIQTVLAKKAIYQRLY